MDFNKSMQEKSDAERKLDLVREALYQKEPVEDNEKIFEVLRDLYQVFERNPLENAASLDSLTRTMQYLELDVKVLTSYAKDLNYALVAFSLQDEALRMMQAAADSWFDEENSQLSFFASEISRGILMGDIDEERAAREYLDVVQEEETQD